MDQDILQAIKTIDDKIASLQEARNRLASAFGIANQPPPVTTTAKTIRIPLPNETANQINEVLNGNGGRTPSGRKVQLAQFLFEQGPMSRVDIVANAGLPEGTVSYCLADKRFFDQLDDGDWFITDFSRRGLERRAKTGTFQAEEH